MILAALVCAAIVVLSVTHSLFDADQWQHLTVGRFLWEEHSFPTTQLWTWPTYGAREVDYAWGFEALVWPFWKLGGLMGLQAWRWLTTLGVFALVWVTARRMGARGFAPLVVIMLAAMVYRIRSQVRPETIAAALLMAEIGLLEARRHGGRVPLGWLVPLAWVWANTHISWYLFFVVLGIHGVAAQLGAKRAGGPSSRGLWLAGLAGLGISLVNPSGWRTLWQPFEYWFVWRHELIYQHVGELRPVDWSTNWRNGLPVLLVLWPVLTLARPGRRAIDRVEVAMCAVFTALLLVGQRFTSFYAVVAAIYLARDLDAWGRLARVPAWAAAPWTRAGLAAAGCLLVAWPEMSRPQLPIHVGLPTDQFPIAASDFISRHDLHGRVYNPYDIGGYLGFRFWPRRDQLPFMGIHQEGSPELRRLYLLALGDPEAWRVLEARYGFDYLVLPRHPFDANHQLAFADGDTAWARVFSDDAAHVYVRRKGPFARLAADSAYRALPASPESLLAFDQRAVRDSTLRGRMERELRREVAGSPWHADALGLLAALALFEGRGDDARRALEEALRIEPQTPGAREQLGIIALRLSRPREALRWFEEERRVMGYRAGLDFRRGQVAAAEGDLARARALYARELQRDAGNQEVRDSLDSVSARLGR
jgi:hypothetical protein